MPQSVKLVHHGKISCVTVESPCRFDDLNAAACMLFKTANVEMWFTDKVGDKITLSSDADIFYANNTQGLLKFHVLTEEELEAKDDDQAAVWESSNSRGGRSPCRTCARADSSWPCIRINN